MTLRQRILKLLYPLLMKVKKKEEKILINKKNVKPAVSFYSLQERLISKQAYSFSSLQGKKVLLVNVASNCGYTGQYSELEALYQRFKSNLVVLGFPANDFKEQEPGTDEEIERFCKVNFGVGFPLFQKHSVLKPDQNEVFQWLTDPRLNGWNEKQPSWNFCKYLVDDEGKLIAVFPPSVSPLSKELLYYM